MRFCRGDAFSRHAARFALSCMMVLALAGCLVVQQRDFELQDAARLGTVAGYPADIRAWGDAEAALPTERLHRIFMQRMEAARSDPRIRTGEINALSLSGGGSSGAFGAGLLAGWTENGTRPSFDVVTGISTGALIAPFAFLGPDYDDELKAAFTTVNDRDILKWTGLRGILRTASLTSNEPLRNMLERYLTSEVIDEIAAEYAKGRRLLIGTTNLDALRPVIWNMGAIAASKRPDRDRLFREVIIASTSIPGVFPPIHFNVNADGRTYDEMHVDGGVTTEVFLMPAGLSLRAVERSLGLRIRSRLFVIRNGRTTPQFDVTEASFPAIAGKAVSSLIDTQAVGDLYRLYAIAKRDQIDYNVIDIPDSFTVKSTSAFDQNFMKALYETGYGMGARGIAWKKLPPGYVE